MNQASPERWKRKSRQLRPILIAALGLLMLIAGCDDGIPGSGPGRAIEREQFVEVMVELRTEGVRSQTGRISASNRDSILGRHGLVEDDLRDFVEVHGRNVPLMTDIWAEVQLRIAEALGVNAEDVDTIEELDDLPDVLP